MTCRVIARTRYNDPASDLVRDFPTERDGQEFLASLGFTLHESIGQVSYYHLPAADDRGRPCQLAGYLVTNIY